MTIMSVGIYNGSKHVYVMNGMEVKVEGMSKGDLPVDPVRLGVVKSIFSRHVKGRGGNADGSGAADVERDSATFASTSASLLAIKDSLPAAVPPGFFNCHQSAGVTDDSQVGSFEVVSTNWEVISEDAVKKHNEAEQSSSQSADGSATRAPAAVASASLALTVKDSVPFSRASIRNGKLCVRECESTFDEFSLNISTAPAIRAILADTAAFILADYFCAADPLELGTGVGICIFSRGERARVGSITVIGRAWDRDGHSINLALSEGADREEWSVTPEVGDFGTTAVLHCVTGNLARFFDFHIPYRCLQCVEVFKWAQWKGLGDMDRIPSPYDAHLLATFLAAFLDTSE